MKYIADRLASILIVLLVGIASGEANAQVVSPCPEVLIEQKYDHIPLRQYRDQGWDTVVSCSAPTIELSVEPYVPVRNFNGTYLVEEVPYNPPDTSFALGTRMPITTDDNFAASATEIPYPFYFFGIRKTEFCLGANGLVTFATNQINASRSCPWGYSSGIPWNSSSSGAPSPVECMRDAIYGIYEDTYPNTSVHGTSGNPNWGIYYGIQDEFPCRKIICSWNDVPQYSCTSLRCTYQIVCYEGSNIIEVHVKQRQVCTSWNGGRGIIGIQNATGQPQTTDPNPTASNHYVVEGSPASFSPAGMNPSTSNIAERAFRFTPQGSTVPYCKWYRIFDDGRDSVVLTTNASALVDSNAYAYVNMEMNINSPADPAHPTRSSIIVSPKVPAKYVAHMRFRNANNDWYNLFDTIVVGIDTANTLNARLLDESYHNGHQLDICQGEEFHIQLEHPDIQSPARINYHVTRILNGEEHVLPESIYTANGTHLIVHADNRSDTLPTNKIDTIFVQSSVDFVSGCFNYDTSLVRIFPNFDTTEIAGICEGQTYVWHLDNQPYTTTTNTPIVHLTSQPGCDSVVHLDLTVYAVSLTIDSITDCKPYTWLNGKTYEESNEATAFADTIILPNRYGCDSIVQLNFTLIPLEARIHSSLDNFDYDHLDVELKDISLGGGERRWIFPSGAPEQTGPTAYYTIPVSLDSAQIALIAYSPYGCIDTSNITLQFNKESFWMPNAFTPDNPQGNNYFSSISQNTINQEMLIYNRRGELIFRCEGVDCKWDGRNFQGEPCPQGAYIYLIRFTNEFEPTRTQIRKGTVTLLR